MSSSEYKESRGINELHEQLISLDQESDKPTSIFQYARLALKKLQIIAFIMDKYGKTQVSVKKIADSIGDPTEAFFNKISIEQYFLIVECQLYKEAYCKNNNLLEIALLKSLWQKCFDKLSQTYGMFKPYSDFDIFIASLKQSSCLTRIEKSLEDSIKTIQTEAQEAVVTRILNASKFLQSKIASLTTDREKNAFLAKIFFIYTSIRKICNKKTI